MKDIKIASIFKSIQGEGLNVGKPTTFVRLYTDKCFPNNKRCKFCDTVNQDYYTPTFTVDDIYKNSSYSSLISLTGGECLSIDSEVLIDFLMELSENFEYIEMESNGAYLQEAYKNNDTELIWTLGEELCNLSISPKLENSGVNYKYDPAIFNAYYEQFYNLTLKFVVGEDIERDFELIDNFVDEASVDSNIVYIMAMTPSTRELQQKIVEECIKRNYNYSPRLHVDIWGEFDNIDR